MPECTRPSGDAPWLVPLLTETVRTLASRPRATAEEKTAARAWLSSELEGMGFAPRLHEYGTGANVHATIPATEGEGKLVVLGAHFDTVDASPGANDNASGVAAVLAAARHLKDVSCRTSPVAIVFFDEEEIELRGSRAFAATLAPEDVRAVHTVDQVAWDMDGDRWFELELPTPDLEKEWRAAALLLGVETRVTTTRGTDHEAFRERGFAAVGLTEEYVGGDTSPHRHARTDLPPSVEAYAEYLTLAARLVARVIEDEVAR